MPLATFGVTPTTPAYASQTILGNYSDPGSFYEMIPLQACSFSQISSDVPLTPNGSMMGGGIGLSVPPIQRPTDPYTQFQLLANSIVSGGPMKSGSPIAGTSFGEKAPTNMTLTLHYEQE